MSGETQRLRKCCGEADCHRAKPFLFLKTPEPENKWLLVTRYQVLASDNPDERPIKVIERHDVTIQIERILLQYREFLDGQLEQAMKIAAGAELERLQTEAQRPKLILPGGGA